MREVIIKSVALTNKSRNVAGANISFDENGEFNLTKKKLIHLQTIITKHLPVAVIIRDVRRAKVPLKPSQPDGDLNPSVHVVDEGALAEEAEQAAARAKPAPQVAPVKVEAPRVLDPMEEAAIESGKMLKETLDDVAPEPVKAEPKAVKVAPRPKKTEKKAPKAKAKKRKVNPKKAKKTASSVANSKVDMLGGGS